MKGCVQWNPVTIEQISISGGAQTRELQDYEFFAIPIHKLRNFITQGNLT